MFALGVTFYAELVALMDASPVEAIKDDQFDAIILKHGGLTDKGEPKHIEQSDPVLALVDKTVPPSAFVDVHRMAVAVLGRLPPPAMLVGMTGKYEVIVKGIVCSPCFT